MLFDRVCRCLAQDARVFWFQDNPVYSRITQIVTIVQIKTRRYRLLELTTATPGTSIQHLTIIASYSCMSSCSRLPHRGLLCHWQIDPSDRSLRSWQTTINLLLSDTSSPILVILAGVHEQPEYPGDTINEPSSKYARDQCQQVFEVGDELGDDPSNHPQCQCDTQPAAH